MTKKKLKLVKGKLYQITWIDAAQSVEWTDEQDLQKLIVQYEKGVEQILTFIKESDQFYAFTTGRHVGDEAYADVMLIPKIWVLQIKEIKI